MPHTLSIVRHNRRPLGFIGLLLLASCLHGAVKPAATLAPHSADGLPRSAGPFAVVHAAPRGRVVDRKQPGVTIMFSRAVRSVEMADDERVPAITIATKSGEAVKGTWRWTGTRGLLFSPEGEIPGGSDFVVTVPAGVRALDGATLAKPYTLELETGGPSVTAVRLVGPKGTTEQAMPADVAFAVELDQSVDPSELQKAASLRVFNGDGDKGEIVRLTASRDARAKALSPRSPESHVALLKPEKPLPRDRQVELVIASSLRGTGGPRAMETAFTKSMRTHGSLHFVDFYCARTEARGRCRAGSDVKVTMSSPVDPQEIKRHAKLGKLPPRPPSKGRAPLHRVDPALDHWLGVTTKLGQRYQVTLTAGMRDVYGEKLAKDVSFDLEVEAPLVAPKVAQPAAPAAAPPPKPYAYAKSAARPGDARPRRERLPYHLDLGVKGEVLEAALAGSARRLPVGAINVPTYATVATSLSDAQATAWVLSRGSTKSFLSRNGLAPSWTTTSAAVNERAVSFIDVDSVLASRKGRGPALFVVSPPGLTGDYGSSESFVTVTDLGVTAKMSHSGGLVWVTRLSTGAPVAGATVAVRTTKEGEVFAATTGADGLAVVPADRFDPLAKGDGPEDSVRDDAAIVVRSGDDWTISKVTRSSVESRLTSDFLSLSRTGKWAGMLFADRGVFRPGETAKVSGVVRVVDGAGLRSVAGRDLRVELRDTNGEQLFDGRAKCDDFGTFALDVPVPKTASLGPATITASALPGGKSHTTETGVFSHVIRVLAYKANEFKVDAEPDKPEYVRGEAAVFTTRGDYLYGAPMGGASVKTTVSRQEISFTPPGLEGFTTSDDLFTGDYAEESKAAEEVDSQDGTLDEGGRFSRKVDLAFADQHKPERIVFEATVQDLSRREVSARTTAILHPGDVYVALRTPPDRFVQAGTSLEPQVAAVTPKGAKRAGTSVKLELVERRWSGVVGEQPDGTPMRSSKPVDSVVASCTTVTTTALTGCELRVPSAGFFIVRATARDARGNPLRASTSIYGIEDAPRTETAWAADDRKGLRLEANKNEFDIGETAKIVLRSPFKEGHALVTVERNGVLHRQVVPIKGPLPVVQVPVRPEFYPNAFVSVVALRGRVSAPPAGGADLGAPDFRLGWTELKINKDAHRLRVAVASSKREYQPGSKVEADVTVTDRDGKPVESALTFYVVDEGVLALTSYATPDPLPAFVARRDLSVFTFDNREKLARIIPMKAGERVNPLGYEYALARAPGGYDKGDDGGDGAGGAKRADFRTTAYFEAGRRTDKAGKAHFAFKLPDNLTTFRVMAVAAGADDRFGSGDSQLTTYRPLMARPALPRILRVGDSLEASVVVSSKVDDKTGAAGGDMTVDVRLGAKGVAVVGPAARTVKMKRGGQTEVRFPIKATAAGDAVLTFDVRSGADSDRVEARRHVEIPTSVESTVVYGSTSDETAIALGDLSKIRPEQGGLTLRVAPSALVGLGSTIERLQDYPYGCTEQLTSRILPMVATRELVKGSGAKLPADLNGAIDAAVEEILKRQNGDGGFGFWERSRSEPWLSAYASFAIGAAAEQKRFVPRDVIERMREYLVFNLAAATRRFKKPEWRPSDDSSDEAPEAKDTPESIDKREAEKKMDFVSATLVANALVGLGTPNPGALNVLYDARAAQPLFAQAALLRAMAKSDMSAAQLKTLRGEVEARLRVGPSEVDVDEPSDDRLGAVLESPTRSLSMVLSALLAVDPKHVLAPRIARRLLATRRDGGWRTTQEDAWALMALADYRRAQERGASAREVTVTLGGDDLLKSSFPLGSLREDKVTLAASELARRGGPLSFAVSGEGPVFFSAELRYATATLPTRARDEGLFVKKYVRSVPASEVAAAASSIPKVSAASVPAGDLVLVDLLFESAEPRDHVVLDDPLPAGLEALDYDLDTTSRGAADAEAKAHEKDHKTVWLGTTFREATSRREVRDDRVVTFYRHLEPGMYRVTYLARATSIGTFVVPPTRIEAMYAPEVYGRTGATSLVVRDKR
jgi:alpha-2-macroglobulin